MISDEDFYGGRTGPLEKFYTEHCSVGPTKLIETIASTTRMTVYADEKVYGFLNLDF